MEIVRFCLDFKNFTVMHIQLDLTKQHLNDRYNLIHLERKSCSNLKRHKA